MARTFICDVHISPKLAARLRAQGDVAFHAIELELGTAPDRTIWEHAQARDAIIITKDSDFAQLSRRLPSGRVILVRLGNCTSRKLMDTSRKLMERFLAELPQLLASLDSGARVVELHIGTTASKQRST